MKTFKEVTEYFHYNTPITFLFTLFAQVFTAGTEPTQQSLMLLVSSFFYLNNCPSVKYMYDHFIGQYFGGSLSSQYYTLNESDLFVDDWPLNLVDVIFNSNFVAIEYPIFLIIDDTLVEKIGDKFQFKGKLYDHTAKNGSNYLYGHCFVSLVIMVPMIFEGKVHYVRIPLMHRMWVKEDGVSKIKMASEMILKVKNKIDRCCKCQLCVLCDSWYPKKEILELHTKHHLPVICGARNDTALFNLPSEPEPGKRGRKPLRGEILPKNLNDVFTFREVKGYNYLIGHRQVLTNIFGTTVCTAYATKSKETGVINLFLATNDLDLSNFDLALIENPEGKALIEANIVYIAFAIYKFRWNIETCYLEQKAYWGFCDYKLRSQRGIEALISLQTLAYAIMSIIPYLSKSYSALEPLSIQERRYRVGELIREILILNCFEDHLESLGNCIGSIRRCQGYVDQLNFASHNESNQ